MARAAVDPTDPVTLLGLLKHPFSRLGDASALEDPSAKPPALRGPRARNWDELKARAGAARPLVERLEAIVSALAWPGETASSALATRQIAAAMEALAADEAGATGELWAGHAGEAMSRLLGALVREGEALPAVTPRQYADLLAKLVEGETVRSGGATHPRLRILGAIEARLVRADRLVVAGLEEGVWPGGAPLDPFLSRPMRERLGLPSPERRIGLAAHDFAQAALALAAGDPGARRRRRRPGAARGPGLGARAGCAGRLSALQAPRAGSARGAPAPGDGGDPRREPDP